MICRAKTTLKKADTDGRIPAYTLDQYIRSELSKQLIDAIKPTLLVCRDDTSSPTVDYNTELVLMTPSQWQHLKETLANTLAHLSDEQQTTLIQLLDNVEHNSTLSFSPSGRDVKS